MYPNVINISMKKKTVKIMSTQIRRQQNHKPVIDVHKLFFEIKKRKNNFCGIFPNWAIDTGLSNHIIYIEKKRGKHSIKLIY
jgi:hypothetical protein